MILPKCFNNFFLIFCLILEYVNIADLEIINETDILLKNCSNEKDSSDHVQLHNVVTINPAQDLLSNQPHKTVDDQEVGAPNISSLVCDIYNINIFTNNYKINVFTKLSIASFEKLATYYNIIFHTGHSPRIPISRYFANRSIHSEKIHHH